MQPCFRIQCLQIFKLYKLAVTWRLAISFDCWLDDSEWFGFSEHSAGRARCLTGTSQASTPGAEGQAPAAPPPHPSRLLGLDTTVTVHKPLFDLLHAGLLA